MALRYCAYFALAFCQLRLLAHALSINRQIGGIKFARRYFVHTQRLCPEIRFFKQKGEWKGNEIA